MEVIEINFCLF